MHKIHIKLTGFYLLLFTSSYYVADGFYVPTEKHLGVKHWTKRNAGSPTDIHCQDSKIFANPTANATYIKIITKGGDTLLTLEDSKPEFSAFDKLLKLRNFDYAPDAGVIQKGNDSSVFIIKRTYDRGVETVLVDSQNKTIILNKSVERSSERLIKAEVTCALLTGYGVTVDPKMDVNHFDRHNMTPILWATLFGQSDLVKSLVLKGANVNEAGLLVTPLLSAVASDDYDLVEFLIKHGANVNKPSGRRQPVTPLHIAALRGRLNITRLLLDYGADLSIRTTHYDNFSPVHFAVYGESLSVVKELASRGADVMVRTYSGKTPLHIAVSLSNVELMHYLLQNGADINAKDNNNVTPLMEAIAHETEEDALKTVQHLIHHHKPDVNAKDNKGRTALSLASARRFNKVYDLLKAHGAE